MSQRRMIIEAVARTLTLCAVADAVEEQERWCGREECEGRGPLGEDCPVCGSTIEPELAELDLHPGPGGDWDDSVPEGYPVEALAVGRGIVADLEIWAGGRGAVDLAEEWACAVLDSAGVSEDGRFEWPEDGPGSLDRFGHCLAMMALGHGVGLGDDVAVGGCYVVPEVGYREFGEWSFDLVGWVRDA